MTPLPTVNEVRIIGVKNLPDVRRGDDLGRLIVSALHEQEIEIDEGDIIVVASKVVAKVEGRIVALDAIKPSYLSNRIGKRWKKDPRLVELILSEAKRLVKMDRGVIITETKHGFVCANAGIDQSNVNGRSVALLPPNPDRSARMIREKIRSLTGKDVAVIVSDTFGRPWREGHVNVCVGLSGLKPFWDYRGLKDPYGYELKVTIMAIADELASAAELVMGKLGRVPVALIKGYPYPKGEGSAKELVRPRPKDLFR